MSEERVEGQSIELVSRGEIGLEDPGAGAEPSEKLGYGSLGRETLTNRGTKNTLVECPAGETVVAAIRARS
jgi:hypothetical protein